MMRLSTLFAAPPPLRPAPPPPPDAKGPGCASVLVALAAPFVLALVIGRVLYG